MSNRRMTKPPASSFHPEFLAALDASPSMMWLSDADFGGTYFNRTWTAFTGRTLDDEVAGGWMSGVHPDDRGNIAAYAEALHARQPYQVEYRLRRHDGAWRWVLDQGHPRILPDGSLGGYVGSCIDITDRRQADQAHARSEERLHLAQEAAAVGTYDWDVDADGIEWSSQMFRLYGIDPETPAKDIYAAWLKRLHPDDRDRADAETREFIASADSLNISFRILHPEKGVRWIEGRGQMKRDADGRATRMIGVNFDVTEQRQTEEDLRESEQRMRDIAANFPGIIFRRVTHPDGRVEYPYFSGLDDMVLNIPRARLAEMHSIEEVSKLIHYDDLDEMLAKFEHSAASLEPLELEGRVVGDDGGVTWVRSISRPRPRPDGALIWDGVLLNVTEQHLRETERERAAAMLSASMDVAGIGTWEYDPVHETICGSRIMNRLFGLPEDGEVRPVESYLQVVHPDDVIRVRRGLSEGGRSGKDTSREYRVVDDGGAVRWISSRGAFTRLSDGNQRLIGALWDVTARKRHEADREAALRHQQTLLSELNHRVKNNLQLVQGMLHLQSKSMPDRAAFASLISRVEAIGDLHAQLSFVSGTSAINFGAYLEELADKLRRSVLAGTNITLICEAERCDLDLDRAVPLGLVVNELATNAIKHAYPNDEPGIIQISLTCDQLGLTVTVSDDGCGFDPSTETQRGGLGMNLVQGMCRQIGATIEQRRLSGVLHDIHLPLNQKALR
jgi:PAS domain S-box-containing protein